MKKYIKTIVVVTFLALLAVGYFYYLSTKEPSNQAAENENNNRELSALLTKDIDSVYPESPKEVVKLYSRITEAYYKTDLTEEQINTLGKQARKLFDDELKATQTEEEFLAELKKEIKEYKNAKRYVSDYKIDESEDVEYKTFEERKYASLNVVYMLREGGNLINSNTKYMLRQNSEGQWKILYWELEENNASESQSK